MPKFSRIVTLYGATFAMGVGAMLGGIAYISILEKLTGQPVSAMAEEETKSEQ
ncbi:hypothetical protein SEA_CRICKO_42 [Streptomyces phage CricKo]|nr:hypothetical protein SEA_RAINYDAI_41 [Streptomyces phage Rainydai]QJD49925.1 hypothetical protein SEA_CRICKO_42 [Streptomyces phage CricKo]QNL30657.1 hypothetical protein SEA_THIQQUMS_42 [Streptomyces phage Thiqqums]